MSGRGAWRYLRAHPAAEYTFGILTGGDHVAGVGKMVFPLSPMKQRLSQRPKDQAL